MRLISALLFLAALGCSHSRSAAAAPAETDSGARVEATSKPPTMAGRSVTFVGLVHQVGSDPFVIWALTLDDGTSYELSQPAAHHGRFRVTGTLTLSRAPLMKGKIIVQKLEPLDVR